MCYDPDVTSEIDPLELASALQVAGYLAEAEPLYRRVLQADPGLRVARDNLIRLLAAEHRWAEAETLLRSALEETPGDPTKTFRLSSMVLADGRWAEGWPLYEARHAHLGRDRVHKPFLSMPEWRGETVERLLIWPEPGYGEMILLARFVPVLEARGIKVTVLCAPELARLLSGAGLTVLATTEGLQIPPHDAWTLCGSLPLRLGTTPDSIPPPLPVVAAPRGRSGGIGIVTSGKATSPQDADRSLPADFAAELMSLPGAVNLDPRQTGARDFQDTAEIIAGLDRVITVDTAVVHLAGSMGKPTAVLLPRVGANWCWLRERADSPWYPSVRLYRQPRPGAWRPALDEVYGDLGLEPAIRTPAADLPALPPHLTAMIEAALKAPVAPRPATRPEGDRRKDVIAAGETDRQRWEDPRQLEAAWNERARLACAFIGRGATVLDLGCGAMALEQFLPSGCRYVPCDLSSRDDRTIVCDFNAGEFPADVACDIVTVLGVLEYLFDPPAFLAKLRALNRPVVMSYWIADGAGPADRRSNGWVNDLTRSQLMQMLEAAGFGRVSGQEINPGQLLMRAEPAGDRAPPERSVWVLSLNNDGNFGDRLGGHVLSQALPANARVTHIHHKPWNAPPEGGPDLLVLGMGNSLFEPLLTDDLLSLVDRAGRTVGIFGTQYRRDIDPSRMAALLDRLEGWWARYEEDLLLYGAGRRNARHLGDWLIEAFPLASWTRDERLVVGSEVNANAPMDRIIERIQSYRRVESPRLHPLLCALTSAEEVSYTEQRERENPDTASEKFRSMLLDVFGMEKPERQFWPVDRAAVQAYKAKVRRNVGELRTQLAKLLA